MALITHLNDIYKNHIDNLFTIATYIDFTEAFDSINHQILLQKLKFYGIDENPLKLFQSYLTNRLQYVQINLASSSHQFISSGVPQGSILGPLLFLIFINDIHSCSNTNYIIYADDTTIYNSSSDIHHLYLDMNTTLNNINKWSQSNRLSINISKTKYMIFNKSVKSMNSIIKIGNDEVYQVDSFKLLGVIIDNNLNYKEHINNLTKKINKSIGIINKIKFFLLKSTLITLYYSIIFSYIYYGNLIWGSTYKTYLCQIYKVQKKISYIIINSSNNRQNLSISDILARYKILTIFEINIFKSCLFFYKNFSGQYTFFKYDIYN